MKRSKKSAKTLIEGLQRADPTLRLAVAAADMPRSVGFASVYRRANAHHVVALLDQLPSDAAVRLWALDGTDERLRRWTVGCGPGGRLDLLNRLVSSFEEPCEVLVLADDDIRFVVGDLSAMLAVGCSASLDLFQPAHSRLSRCAYKFTQKRWLVSARRTTFVEQGPVIALSPVAQRELLPFPTDFGMGWGVEVRWSEAADGPLRAGVVDAVAVRHDSGPGHGYDVESERRRLSQELARVGASDLRDLQHELERHRPRLRHRAPDGASVQRRTG